jgi:integrase
MTSQGICACSLLGINTNLRASDLLRITAGMVRHLEAGDELTLKEKKTGKHRRITLNKAVIASIQALLNSRDYQDDDPLFLGQRGCLTVSSVNRLVKTWCAEINLKGNYGSHSLAQDLRIHQRTTYGVGIAELMVRSIIPANGRHWIICVYRMRKSVVST